MSFVITCIAPKPTMEMPMLLEQLCARLNTSYDKTAWLSHERAFDMLVDNISPVMQEMFDEIIEDMPLDVAMQPVEHRKKKLLICDMDSTIIEQECIDELADKVGMRDKVAAITEKAMKGELEFEAALKERVALLQGLNETTLEEVWHAQITLTPGAEALVRTMKADGALTALVSGGFTFFTEKVAMACGFASHHANQLLIENGALTGEVALPILGKDAKVEQLKRLMAEHSIDPKETLAIGDGANDIPMLQAAGLGIAYEGKPAVRKAAGAAINYGDLTTALYIQGYSDADITRLQES